MNGAGNKVGIETDPVSSREQEPVGARHSYQFKGECRSPDKLAELIVCRQVLLPRISMRAADSMAAGKVVTEGTKKKALGRKWPNTLD